MSRGRKAGSAGAALLLLLAGCGGGTRQDAQDKSATFKVSIAQASFPAAQHLAEPQQMNISVRNADHATIPNIAVSVDGFTNSSKEPGLADPSRPTYVVDNGPFGGEAVDRGTWALGALRPGQTKTFTWHVTAITPGTFTLHYRVAAGLTGKARAELSGGGIPQGAFHVNVTHAPNVSHVDPNSGRVIRSPAKPSSNGSSGSGSSSGGSSGSGSSSGGVQTGGSHSPPPPGY